MRAQIEETTSDYDREKLQERLAKLAGGVAVIKVGAATETEMKEKKARVEDALHATRAAVEEGIVPGGGVALLRAASALDKLKGRKAMRRSASTSSAALAKSRFARSSATRGYEGAIVIEKIRANKDAHFGFNAASGGVRGPGEGRRHRSDQGDAVGSAERVVDQRTDADDRSDDLRDPGEETRSDARR